MASTTKNIKYVIASEESPIQAALTPSRVEAVSKTPIVFTTQGSIATDGSDLSFTWDVNLPMGSVVSVVVGSTSQEFCLVVSEDGAEATLYPDVNGVYEILVTASNPSGSVSQASALALLSSVPNPIVREKPDSSFIGDSVGSFWRLIENKGVIQSLWSEYIRLLSSDYRKVAEIVLSKSIATIQPGRTASNVVINPEIDLNENDTVIKFSDSFCGTGTGFTAFRALTHRALAINTSTLLFLDINPSNTNIGTNVEVYDTSLGGEYIVNNIKSNRLTLSAKTPLPSTSLSTEVTDLAHISGSKEAFTMTPNSIEKGFYIKYKGAYIEVTDTYTTDSTLPGPNYIRLATAFRTTASNIKASFYSPVPVSVVPVETGLTSVLFVPSNEVGGDGFFATDTLNVSSSITSRSTVLMNANLDNIVGSTVRFLNGSVRGFVSKIIAKSSHSSTYSVYSLEPPMPVNYIDETNFETVRMQLVRKTAYSDLLLTVGRVSCEIVNITYIQNADGTSVASIKVKEPVLVADQTNLDWRICNTLIDKDTTKDYALEGVSYGDVLRVELSISLNELRSFVDCTVVGAYENKVAFEITTQPLINEIEPVTQNDPVIGELLKPSVNPLVLGRVFQQLNIPAAGRLQDGSVSFTSVAETAVNYIPYVKNQLKYRYKNRATFSVRNSSDEDTIYVTSGGYSSSIMRLSVRPTKLTRNSRILIGSDIPVVSIPSLTEFVYPKNISDIEGTDQKALLHNDNSISIRNRDEVVLFENVQFTLQNELSFSGTDLVKAEGSMLVSSASGDFIERGVDPGDFFICNGQFYIVKEVINGFQLEISTGSDTDTFKSSSKVDEAYVIQKRTYYSKKSYVSFREGVFSPTNPVPKRLIASTVILDNTKQIQDNFGALVGYSLSDFVDYSTPQISYLNAVKGLMYAWSVGPTLYAARVASCILLNLPVTEEAGIIRKIDLSTGKVVIQAINRDRLIDDRTKTYSFSTSETISPFFDIERNPETGSPYQVGDVISPMTPITGRVLIQDYRNYPKEFLSLPLRKYHSWRIFIDSNSVDSRDIPVLFKFFNNIKPIYTKPNIVLCLYLYDNVTVYDFLKMHSTVRLYDDPGFSIEATHMVDNSNNSGQILRLSDDGELSTRTLFLGRDLVFKTTTGVVSARGGFVLDDPSLFSTSTDLVVQPDTKVLGASYPFGGSYHVRGKHLVRAGDILKVYTGPNAGVYEVTAVNSDTALSIAPLTGYLPFTLTPTPGTAKEQFGVYRVVSPVIVPSLTVTASTAVTWAEARAQDFIEQAEYDVHTLEDLDGNGVADDPTGAATWRYVSTFSGEALNWDGVSVGDFLVKSSDKTESYEILDIEYNPINEDAAVRIVTGSLVPSSTEFFVYRDALVHKYYQEGSVTGFDFAQEPRRIEHDITDIHEIAVNDIIEFTDGANLGKLSKVVKVTSSAIFVSDALLSSTLGDKFRLIKGTSYMASNASMTTSLYTYQTVTLNKGGRAAQDSSDKRLEYLHGYDDVSITLGRSSVASASAVTTSASGADFRTITGISAMTRPGDSVQLLSGGVLMYEGVVSHLDSNQDPVCYDNVTHASLSTGTPLDVKIVRRSRP